MVNDMKSKKTTGYINAALAFTLLVATGCSDNNDNQTGSSGNSSVSPASISDIAPVTADDMFDEDSEDDNDGAFDYLFSERDISGKYDEISAEINFNGNNAAIDGNGAQFKDSVLTITDEGVYHISGKLDDGQIIVDSEGKIQLVLDGADISCSNSAPIYIKNSQKTFITLAENSENTLTDGNEYLNTAENEPDAAVFSCDSLTVNGSGSLTVNANYNEGITSKDDIIITGGTINIVSVGNGIKGKDYVAMCGGTVNIDAGGDGVKSSNTNDSSLGFVYIKDGTLNITSGEDGIQAETAFTADGGTVNIVAGGGNTAAKPKQNNDFGGMGGGMKGHDGFGRKDFQDQDNSQIQLTAALTDENTENNSDTSTSKKGIKSGAALNISSGTFNIDSADDSLHSNGNADISGGDITIISGDKGIHGDSSVNITDGKINITKSYEGIEASVISISGGNVEIQSSDDGLNASDGSQQGAMGNNTDGIELNISGGFVYVNADGDGLDSNGNINISGGTVLVDGPTNGGNGALDGNGDIIVSGGTLVAAGSSQMAEYPDNSSEQHSVSIGLGSYQEAGTLITICDSNENAVISYVPSKTFDHIVISSPEIKSGETYTINIGGTFSGDSDHGLCTGYKGDGEKSDSFTADEMITLVGSQSSMGGGFGGRHDGEMPEGDFRKGNGDMPELPDGEMPTGDFQGRPDNMPELPDGDMPPDRNFRGQPPQGEPSPDNIS